MFLASLRTFFISKSSSQSIKFTIHVIILYIQFYILFSLLRTAPSYMYRDVSSEVLKVWPMPGTYSRRGINYQYKVISERPANLLVMTDTWGRSNKSYIMYVWRSPGIKHPHTPPHPTSPQFQSSLTDHWFSIPDYFCKFISIQKS